MKVRGGTARVCGRRGRPGVGVGVAVRVAVGVLVGWGVEAGPPCQPSCAISKSLALIAEKAGFKTSLSQRLSNVPETKRSEPLSATIKPCVFIARKIFWTSGVKPEMSFPAFSRRRAPIGSACEFDPARCEAGKTYPLVARTVTRKA